MRTSTRHNPADSVPTSLNPMYVERKALNGGKFEHSSRLGRSRKFLDLDLHDHQKGQKTLWGTRENADSFQPIIRSSRPVTYTVH